LFGRITQGFEERNGGFGGQVFVIVVIYLDHGGINAGTETFNFEEREDVVFGCLARMNT
jgi:hypothetical protein